MMLEAIPTTSEHDLCRGMLADLLARIKDAGELLARCMDREHKDEEDESLDVDIVAWFRDIQTNIVGDGVQQH